MGVRLGDLDGDADVGECVGSCDTGDADGLLVGDLVGADDLGEADGERDGLVDVGDDEGTWVGALVPDSALHNSNVT